MWVESEVSQGSRFFFTIASQLCPMSMENMIAKMQPFNKRTVMYMNTLGDDTGVVDRIRELHLKPFTIREVRDVKDKATCPHIDTIVVDSHTMVSLFHFADRVSMTWFRRPSN
jgi:osomolarity two-component system, sensor histidine kinase NIK1